MLKLNEISLCDIEVDSCSLALSVYILRIATASNESRPYTLPFCRNHFLLLYHEWNATSLILSKIGCFKRCSKFSMGVSTCLQDFYNTLQCRN